jgi:multiple antibiotic resistance protein
MGELATSFAVALSAVFIVVEPFGVAPFFASLTAGRPAEQVRAIAGRASLVGASVLVAFTLLGGPLLRALDIQLDAFRAAGGLLLLLTVLDMLRGRRQSCRCTPEEAQDGAQRHDIAIVPLAVPLLAGPGAMATVMMLFSTGGLAQTAVVLAAIGVTFAASYAVLRAAGPLQRLAGPSVIAVVERVLGLLLAAMAIQFIASGLLGLFWLLS